MPPPSPATPSLFRSRRALEALNIAAVGVSLSAITASVFRAAMSGADARIVFVTATPTLLLGTLWAALLRSPKTVGGTSLRRGWLLSLPLAIANAAFAGGLLMFFEPHGGSLSNFFMGMALGATFGVVFWLPGLLLTLAFFGLPIASAQSLAKKGLAGEERGERIVGVASTVMAGFALLGSLVDARGRHGADVDGVWAVRALAVLGAGLGLVAAVAAWRREEQRSAFVSRVEAGAEPHFRVDATEEGKVLVRVISQGEGYRVTDYAEEVAALDREGAVTRAAREE